MDNSICGVAINDADYKTSSGRMIDGKWKTEWRCPFYRVWMHMLDRCYRGRHKYHSAYQDCSVSNDWLRFSNFKSWMEKQDWKGKTLDKDLLIPGNRIYSSDRCVFISGDLNKFLISQRGNREGSLPGATWVPRISKFQAQCRNPFSNKREFLGYFEKEEDAHLAWKRRKHTFSCMYADMMLDHRIEMALRTRYM